MHQFRQQRFNIWQQPGRNIGYLNSFNSRQEANLSHSSFWSFFALFFTLIPHNNALKMLQVRCEHGYTPLTWVCYGIRLCSIRKIDLIAPCGLAVGLPALVSVVVFLFLLPFLRLMLFRDAEQYLWATIFGVNAFSCYSMIGCIVIHALFLLAVVSCCCCCCSCSSWDTLRL